MELTSDLITIQGLITGLEQTAGDFRRVKHRGGNESIIKLVINEFEKFLKLKDYITDNKVINMVFKNEITNVVMFLVLNTEFEEKSALDIKEYSHLVGIMPVLSKCLLANIIIKLNLSEYYCYVLQQLPIHLSEELLVEIVVCLKKSTSIETLENTYIFIKEIIHKLNCVDLSSFKTREAVTNLNNITSNFLYNILGVDIKRIYGWNQNRYFQHIGFTILKLMKLLRCCQTDNESIAKIIDELIRGTCNMYKIVTTITFCAWSEVQYKGESLQTVIKTEAYYLVEKYSKFKPAKELVQILGGFASRPITVDEQILVATSDQMVAKIEECDVNQLKWFAALLRTRIYDSQLTMDCIHKWAKLCTLEDVSHLLKESIGYETDNVKKLVLLCASQLSVQDLSIVINRFFHQSDLKSKNHLQCTNVTQDLTYLLNKINHNKERNLSLHELENTHIKDIQILLLQNPEELIYNLYTECIQNTVYTFWLKHAFAAIVNIMKINDIGLKTLEKCLKENKLNANSLNGFLHLILMLEEAGCIDDNLLISELFLPQMSKYLIEKNCADLKCMLLITKELKFQTLNIHHKINWKLLLLKILEEFRCGFTDFTNLRMEISIETVNNLVKLKDSFLGDLRSEEFATFSRMNHYYINNNFEYLNSVYPGFNLESHPEAVSKLIKVLPRCVPQEWILIGNELDMHYHSRQILEVLTDCLILICHVASTQNIDDNTIIFTALKYNLQNYGAIIKNIKKHNDNQDYEINVIKNVCRLLKAIPPPIRFHEGINLVTLFAENALRILINDKHFVASLVSIEDTQLTQVIAKKMLSTI